MAGLGDIIEGYITDPLRKALGVYRPPEGPTELPQYGYYSDELNRENTFKAPENDPFYGFRRSTRPASLPERLVAYRADERRGGLETLPQARFDARSPLKSDVRYWHTDLKGNSRTAAPEIKRMYAYARLAGAAQKLGLPAIGPDQFAAMVLKEGRPDAGYNTFFPKAKADLDFQKKLSQYNIPDWQKNYLGMINYADRISKKKGVPFEAVWNGLGRSADSGKTGFDYAKAMKAHQQAVLDPKNAEFRAFVHNAFKEGAKYGLPTMKEKARDTDPMLKSDPKYKYHTPEGKIKPHGLEGLFKAEGGVVIDDGNPAKQRKLI